MQIQKTHPGAIYHLSGNCSNCDTLLYLSLAKFILFIQLVDLRTNPTLKKKKIVMKCQCKLTIVHHLQC